MIDKAIIMVNALNDMAHDVMGDEVDYEPFELRMSDPETFQIYFMGTILCDSFLLQFENKNSEDEFIEKVGADVGSNLANIHEMIGKMIGSDYFEDEGGATDEAKLSGDCEKGCGSC